MTIIVVNKNLQIFQSKKIISFGFDAKEKQHIQQHHCEKKNKKKKLGI
jgi:hypothetical protein